MEIIKRGEIVTSTYRHVADDEALPAGDRDITVSLARLVKQPELLDTYGGRIGVRLVPGDELDALLPHLDRIAIVAVEFPKFTDGRGYSLARLLRDRHGYRGELRAIGHVLRDQLFYLHRCGFDAFEMAPGKSLDDALQAFGEFSVRYQAAADDPRPLFRRRMSA